MKTQLCIRCGELVPQGCCTCGPKQELVSLNRASSELAQGKEGERVHLAAFEVRVGIAVVQGWTAVALQLVEASDLLAEVAELEAECERLRRTIEKESDALWCPRCGVVFHDRDMEADPEEFWTCPLCGTIQHTVCRGPLKPDHEMTKLLAERQRAEEAEHALTLTLPLLQAIEHDIERRDKLAAELGLFERELLSEDTLVVPLRSRDVQTARKALQHPSVQRLTERKEQG